MATAGNLVQYIILRRDLIPKGASKGEWPLGAIVAQACHASTACLYRFRQDPHVQAYLDNLDQMHKVILQAPNLTAMEDITRNAAALDLYPWIEQPENVLTAIAFKPYPKETVQPFVSHLKLLR